MHRPFRLALLAGALLMVSGPALAKRTAEDVLRGRIILSKTMFPSRFKSDRQMVKVLKRAHTRGFWYDPSGTLNIEIMAFFARPQASTSFTATVYDVTEGRTLVNTFDIYPGQSPTRTLNSGIVLDRDTYPAERKYLLVITPGFRGHVLAEARFSLKRPKGEKVARGGATVVDFGNAGPEPAPKARPIQQPEPVKAAKKKPKKKFFELD